MSDVITLSNIIIEWINEHNLFKHYIRVIDNTYYLRSCKVCDILSYAPSVLEHGSGPLYIATIYSKSVEYEVKDNRYIIDACNPNFFTKLEKLIKERHYVNRWR